MQRIAVEYKLDPPSIVSKAVEADSSELGYLVVRELGGKWRLPRENECFGETAAEALQSLRDSLAELQALAGLYQEAMKI